MDLPSSYSGEAEQVCSVGVSTTGLWQMYGILYHMQQCMGEYIILGNVWEAVHINEYSCT